MSTTTLTPRQSFRETVALVAARAKERLPQAVNGRLEGAVKLVLSGDVLFLADGTIEVGSCTDPTKTYRLVGQTCECKDFTDGKAPDGWCRHRISAGILKRVQELLPPVPEPPVPMVPDYIEAWPDNSPELAPEEPPPAAPVAPLPEMPLSINVRFLSGGRDYQMTFRGLDDATTLARMEAVLQRYPVEPPPAPGETREGWCAQHSVQMRWFEAKDRKPATWLHKTPEGRWCKGNKGR